MHRIRTMTAWIRHHPIVSAVSGAVGIGLVASLVFGVFALQLLFVDDVVQEADPFALASDPEGGTSGGARPGPADATPRDPVAAEPSPTDVADPGVGTAPTPSVLAAGEFVDRSHPTSGRAAVLTDGTRRVLRLDDLVTDNGPDLNVYLVAAGADAPVGELGADVVDLGDLKGNIGDQNYDIPADVDLDRYGTVVVWCVRFGVAFGAAELA